MRHGAGPRWLSLLVLVACGGDGGSASLDEVGSKVTEALCALSVRCASTPDAQTCRASQRIDMASVKAAVKAGRLVYHADRGAACVQALGALGCHSSFLGEEMRACSEMLEGRVAAGGTCYANDECSARGRCEDQEAACDTEVQCCAGKCKPVRIVGAGQTCDDETSCDFGLVCAYEDPSAPTGTCRTLSKQGESCEDVVCGDALRCDKATNTCKPLVASGQACAAAFDCEQPDETCIDGRCKQRLAVGAACDDTFHCVPWADCSDGKCVAQPKSGEACSDGGPLCLGGLDCVDGKCAFRPAAPACM